MKKKKKKRRTKQIVFEIEFIVSVPDWTHPSIGISIMF